VEAAVVAVTEAKSEADREAAKARLQELQKQKTDLDTQLAAAKAEGEKAQRLKGVKISKECQDNPLAKGCM
jgi:hypothetical protein